MSSQIVRGPAQKIVLLPVKIWVQKLEMKELWIRVIEFAGSEDDSFAFKSSDVCQCAISGSDKRVSALPSCGRSPTRGPYAYDEMEL